MNLLALVSTRERAFRGERDLEYTMKRKIHIVLIVLLLFCIAAIFLFSTQTSKDSGNLSKGVTKELLTVVKPSFSELPQQEQQSIVNVVFLKVRKLAHFSLFGVLGALSVCVLTLWDYRHKRGLLTDFILAVMFCFLYACTDEFHQLFVAGRGAQLKDVMLDTAGAFCGALIMTALIVLVQFVRGRNRGKHAA